jgi:hypothetical protein
LQDPDAKVALLAMNFVIFAQSTSAVDNQPSVAAEKVHTLGKWAET